MSKVEQFMKRMISSKILEEQLVDEGLVCPSCLQNNIIIVNEATHLYTIFYWYCSSCYHKWELNKDEWERIANES